MTSLYIVLLLLSFTFINILIITLYLKIKIFYVTVEKVVIFQILKTTNKLTKYEIN